VSDIEKAYMNTLRRIACKKHWVKGGDYPLERKLQQHKIIIDLENKGRIPISKNYIFVKTEGPPGANPITAQELGYNSWEEMRNIGRSEKQEENVNELDYPRTDYWKPCDKHTVCAKCYKGK